MEKLLQEKSSGTNYASLPNPKGVQIVPPAYPVAGKNEYSLNSNEPAHKKANTAEGESKEGYEIQLKQLNRFLEDKFKTRALTLWAIDFFSQNPNIEEIAQTLTSKVDSVLFAVNSLAETWRAGFILNYDNHTFRGRTDKYEEIFLNSLEPSMIGYRIPRPLAVALESVEVKRGKCEEHAMLTIYLLTIGHMIQNMPFGRLKGDIYYTGLATEGTLIDHAIVVLVQGKEFKSAVEASIEENERISPKWLNLNLNLWGPSAWIVDGWDGNARPLSKEQLVVSPSKSENFRRNPGESLSSEWDVTVLQMANRVAQDYGID